MDDIKRECLDLIRLLQFSYLMAEDAIYDPYQSPTYGGDLILNNTVHSGMAQPNLELRTIWNRAFYRAKDAHHVLGLKADVPLSQLPVSPGLVMRVLDEIKDAVRQAEDPTVVKEVWDKLMSAMREWPVGFAEPIINDGYRGCLECGRFYKVNRKDQVTCGRKPCREARTVRRKSAPKTL